MEAPGDGLLLWRMPEMVLPEFSIPAAGRKDRRLWRREWPGKVPGLIISARSEVRHVIATKFQPGYPG